MKRSAAFLAVLSFALSARAVPSAPSAAGTAATPPPAIVARAEVRGIAPLIDMTERIAGADNIPPGQLRAMVTMMTGLDPVALFGEGTEPVRSIVYAVPGAGEAGVILDVPAANGDTDAFFATLAGIRWTEQPIPEKHAAKLPEGARLFHASGVESDTRVLALPHGGRVALLPFAQRGGLRPAQVPGLLAAAAPIPSEGTVAFAADVDALVPLLPRNGDGNALAAASGLPAVPGLTDILGQFPVRELEFAFGLDGADRLRIAYAATPREGTLEARLSSGAGAPAASVNAILFPEAIAAFSQRMPPAPGEEEIRAFLERKLDANPAFRTAEAAQREVLDRIPALYAKWLAAAFRFSGTGNSFVLLPADGKKRCPWAFCAEVEDAAGLIDSIPGLFAEAVEELGSWAAGAAAAAGEEDDAKDVEELAKLAFRAEFAGGREVGGTAVRTIAVRATDPETKHDYTLFSFDAAAAGSSLLLANLAEPALAGVLADLARGETARAPLADLPAFREAIPAPDADADAVFIRLVPAAQTVLKALKARCDELDAEEQALEEAAEASGAADADDGGGEDEVADNETEEEEDEPFFDDAMLSFLDMDNLPACTIAVTSRHDEESGRSESLFVLPIADLKALYGILSPLFSPAADEEEDFPADDEEDGEDGEEDEGEDAFGDW